MLNVDKPGWYKQTFIAAEAPAHVDVRVVLHGSDRLEVFGTHDVEARQVDAACRDTEITHVVGRGTAYTAQQTTWMRYVDTTP